MVSGSKSKGVMIFSFKGVFDKDSGDDEGDDDYEFKGGDDVPMT